MPPPLPSGGQGGLQLLSLSTVKAGVTDTLGTDIAWTSDLWITGCPLYCVYFLCNPTSPPIRMITAFIKPVHGQGGCYGYTWTYIA